MFRSKINHVNQQQIPESISTMKSTPLIISMILLLAVVPIITMSSSPAGLNNAYASSQPQALLLSGRIASIQTYDSGEPFMLSGDIRLIAASSGISRVTSTFTMVKIDGEDYHKMILKDFKLTDIGHNTIVGTIDVYGKHGDSAPFIVANDAPVTIDILNDVVFAINIDKDAVHGHFGNNPIYGEVLNLRN
jgi:hypothetical protein